MKGAATRSYAAILVDLQLPDSDGISLIKNLRAQPRYHNTPIVVVSADPKRGRDDKRSSTLNVLDWLQKPVDTERLLHVLNRPIVRDNYVRPRILHLDDDRDVLRLVAQALGSTAEVVSVESIDEARHVLDTHHFDLAVLDVGLAEGFGLDLLPDLCGADGRPIPVVVFSAQDIARGRGARAGRADEVARLDRQPGDDAAAAGGRAGAAAERSQGGRMTAVRVLHVDDEPDIREVVELSLGLDPDLTVRSLRLRRRCARGGGGLAARPDPARRHDAGDGRADHADASAAKPADRRHPGGVHDGAGAAARARAFRLARRRGRDRQAVRSDDARRLGAQLYRRPVGRDRGAARELPRARARERQGAGARSARRLRDPARRSAPRSSASASIAHSIAGGGAIFGFVAMSRQAAELEAAVERAAGGRHDRAPTIERAVAALIASDRAGVA